MEKSEVLEEILKEVDKYPEIMSRRDALKYFTLSPLAASVIASANTTELKASDVKGKIVIVGGGLAGISTAARLQNKLNNPDITIIEPNPISPSYQPGLVLVAAGVWDISEIIYKVDDKLPHGVKLIKAKATSFDPQNNKLILDTKEEINYDQLIIATGVSLNYGAIKGLDGEITSFDKNITNLQDSGLTKDGLHSVYFKEGAQATLKGIEELIQKAKNHTGTRKLQAIFTHPNTPIKCEGVPKTIMYITHAKLLEAGVRDKVEMIFNTNDSNMFAIKEFHDAIVKQFEERDFKWNYKHNLIEVDPSCKVAIFDKIDTKQGTYNKDLEKCETLTTHEKIEVGYDFLHISPPMKVHDEITTSPLASVKSWIPVNKKTMQHIKFDNVWSLGDAASIPLGKTAASIRKQYKILSENIIAQMENKSKLPAKYDGYTVCPFITDFGKVMLSEFDWSMKPQPTFPLDATRERWIWWLLKVYALKPMTMMGMMKGYA